METKNRKGFTLLELLVVVLIIGILAGIALPQYNKVVWKARFAEVYTVTNALEKGIDSYILTNGIPNNYVNIFDQLDIDVSSNLTKKELNNIQLYCSKYICYSARCEDGECMWIAEVFSNMSGNDFGNLKIQMQGIIEDSSWYRICWYEDWDIGKTFCESTNWDDIGEGI